MSFDESKNEEIIINDYQDDVYGKVKQTLDNARAKSYTAVNFNMVKAYWEIGKIIYLAQENSDRAQYGKEIIINLSKQLTTDYGKGFDKSNLTRMRKFYVTFQNVDALRQELSWTHYRLLLKIEDEKKLTFYMDECIKSNWSTRQLERQINSFYYERLLSTQEEHKEEVKNETIVKYSILEESKQIFASKYMLYMPTEEELKREIDREREILEIERGLNDEN